MVAQKFAQFFVRLYQILTNFQIYFTVTRKFVNNTATKDLKTPQMCLDTTPCGNVNVLKVTIKNKTTSVTTHFKKLTTRNNVFIVSVII